MAEQLLSQPQVPGSVRYTCSLFLRMTTTLPLTRRFPARHALVLFPVFFMDQQNSCSCLLLVRSVAAWETGGFILSHGEPMGTEVHSPISLLLPV
jgi:hypothetical protein